MPARGSGPGASFDHETERQDNRETLDSTRPPTLLGKGTQLSDNVILDESDGTLHSPADSSRVQVDNGLRTIVRASKSRTIPSVHVPARATYSRKRTATVRNVGGYRRELPDAVQSRRHVAVGAPRRYRGPGWEVRSEASEVKVTRMTGDTEALLTWWRATADPNRLV